MHRILDRGLLHGDLALHVLAYLFLIVNGDVRAEIISLEERSNFIAVMQGGVINAGRPMATACARDQPLTA